MAALETEVLVIGGGSTGVGVARDAAMRGFKTILVEREDLADGTTGRYHGLLHSGEGATRSRTPMPPGNASSRTSSFGGLPPTASRTPAACSSPRRGTTPPTGTRSSRAARATGIPVEEIAASEALRRGPRLHPDIFRAFTVPDAALDPWKLVDLRRSAQEHGAQILLYHRLLDSSATARGSAARSFVTS